MSEPRGRKEQLRFDPSLLKDKGASLPRPKEFLHSPEMARARAQVRAERRANYSWAGHAKTPRLVRFLNGLKRFVLRFVDDHADS